MAAAVFVVQGALTFPADKLNSTVLSLMLLLCLASLGSFLVSAWIVRTDPHPPPGLGPVTSGLVTLVALLSWDIVTSIPTNGLARISPCFGRNVCYQRYGSSQTYMQVATGLLLLALAFSLAGFLWLSFSRSRRSHALTPSRKKG